MLNNSRTAAHQQLVAFAWCGSMEVKIPGTGLVEQVLANDAAKLHRVRIPMVETHQLFTADPMYTAGHHRLDGGLRRLAVKAAGIVAHELPRKREPRDVLVPVTDAPCHILEAALHHKAKPL